MKPYILLLLLSYSAFSVVQSAESIKITNAWVRNPPPQTSVTALFMGIYNQGKDTVLIGIESEDFARLEIHQTSMIDGMMSMQQQSQLALPQNTMVKLQPGGLHIMLFSPKKPLKEGEYLDFRLVFSDGNKQSLKAQIQNM